MSHPDTPQTADEFLSHLFEDAYCPECGGDAEHHEVIGDFPFPGTFYAHCQYEPTITAETVTLHPVVHKFHADAGRDPADFCG